MIQLVERLGKTRKAILLADWIGLVAVAGAKTLLSSIPQTRWAIVTSCTQKLAEVRLQSVGLPVPAVMVARNPYRGGNRILKVIWKPRESWAGRAELPGG